LTVTDRAIDEPGAKSFLLGLKNSIQNRFIGERGARIHLAPLRSVAGQQCVVEIGVTPDAKCGMRFYTPQMRGQRTATANSAQPRSGQALRVGNCLATNRLDELVAYAVERSAHLPYGRLRVRQRRLQRPK
jgi:hypothetical protein